jgi:hypothetical protein
MARGIVNAAKSASNAISPESFDLLREIPEIRQESVASLWTEPVREGKSGGNLSSETAL